MSSIRRPPPSPPLPLHTSAAAASTSSQSGRATARGGGRSWRAPTRGDLLIFLIAATLCSASYWLGISHNSRGVTDSRVLGLSAAAPGSKSSCVVRGVREGDADEPLDFEAHHDAESAGLSVSASAAKARTTTGARRALLGTGTAPASRSVPRRR